MLPVLQRELRVQARQSATGWMRLACAFITALGLAVAMTIQVTTWTPTGPVSAPIRGPELFQVLARLLAMVILLLGPLMTADCLSRERREGTLPLLWLTPLTPRGVLLAKLSAGSFRLITIVLAAAPMLTVPLLIGGVSLTQLRSTAALLATLMLLSVGSGVWASARCTRFQRALIAAYSAQAVGVWILAQCAMILSPVLAVGPRWSGSSTWLSELSSLFSGLTLPGSLSVPPFRGVARWITPGVPAPPTSVSAVPLELLPLLLLALTCFWFVLFLYRTSRRLKQSVHERPLTTEEIKRRETWVRPRFFQSLFQRRRLQMLAQNPLRWLDRRTPVQSISRWLWLGVVGFVWISVLGGYSWGSSGNSDLPLLTATLLAVGLVLWATGALREESRNGGLELLLVTGLHESQLLRNVLAGSLSTFGLAVLLQGMVASFLGIPSLGCFWVLAGAIGCAPLVALGFSVRGYPFTPSAALTFTLAILLPWSLAEIIVAGFSQEWVPLSHPVVQFWAFGMQILIAIIMWQLRISELVSRRFITRRVAT